MKKRSKNLNTIANELLRAAKSSGTEQNYFFTTAFERYKKQIELFERLSKLSEDNPTDLKIVGALTKAMQICNQTEGTLMRVITTFAKGSYMTTEDDDDEL